MFYTQAKKKGAYNLADKWWFVLNHEIKRKLNCPCIEKISANKRFFYFDDYVVEEK